MSAAASSRSKSALFLREIRVEHTLFALPFAYTGAVLAARGVPSGWALLWITLAVLGARTAAMCANRYLDRHIDARNPRTERRAVASGRLAPATMLWAAGAGLALLVVSAWMLNPLCVKLLPLAALGVLAYPLCKRFTWLTHFFLGAVDALAPLGAFIGVAGSVSPAAVLLFVAVTLWVAGFDVLYALMDLAVDTAQGLRSLPARFGDDAGRAAAIALHACTALALAAAGILAAAGWPYAIGVVAMAGVTVYEIVLLRRSPNVFALNDRVFNVNMAFSVVFLCTTVAGMLVR